ncbi:hypothetical protein C8R44DRAFT_750505 [Mycena epipterygia]|nr:hypothetical protein C8R44DRAFT_750505 [Mycena epipterygia]
MPEHSDYGSSSDSDSDDGDPTGTGSGTGIEHGAVVPIKNLLSAVGYLTPEAAVMGVQQPVHAGVCLAVSCRTAAGLAVPLAIPAAAEPPADADAGAAGARQLL